MFVSSANKTQLSNFESLNKSLMYKLNNLGPNVDPWGTIQEMTRQLDEDCTYCSLSLQ